MNAVLYHAIILAQQHPLCKEEIILRNKRVRDAIEKAGLKYWEVADAIGISPYTFSTWLRHELTGERLERVQAALEALSGGKAVVE